MAAAPIGYDKAGLSGVCGCAGSWGSGCIRDCQVPQWVRATKNLIGERRLSGLRFGVGDWRKHFGCVDDFDMCLCLEISEDVLMYVWSSSKMS